MQADHKCDVDMSAKVQCNAGTGEQHIREQTQTKTHARTHK